MYAFLTGAGFWFSLTVFFVGCLIRVMLYFRGLNWQLDRVAYAAYPAQGLKGALRSIYKWLMPFGTNGWRRQPVMTVLFFSFHTGAVLVPLFLLAHQTFLEDKIGVSVFSLPVVIADFLTWLVVVSAVFIVLRRLVLPEVRILTTWNDYLIMLVSVAPFMTGLVARYELGSYDFWLTAHILCGEIFLILVPFTKLSHIVLFFASRAQLGMDFGIKRGGLKGTKMAW